MDFSVCLVQATCLFVFYARFASHHWPFIFVLLKIDFKLKKSSLSNYIVFDYEFLSTSVIAVDLLGIYMYGLITVYTCCKLFYVRYVSHCHCPIQELIFTGRGNMLLNFNTRMFTLPAISVHPKCLRAAFNTVSWK